MINQRAQIVSETKTTAQKKKKKKKAAAFLPSQHKWWTVSESESELRKFCFFPSQPTSIDCSRSGSICSNSNNICPPFNSGPSTPATGLAWPVLSDVSPNMIAFFFFFAFLLFLLLQSINMPLGDTKRRRRGRGRGPSI